MSCGVGGRCGLDPMLLCLWHRPTAIALIGLLVWEPPYALGVALKKKKKKKKGGKRKNEMEASKKKNNLDLAPPKTMSFASKRP